MAREIYSDSDYGIWEVRGEDTNADLGGSHYQRLLGYFEGTYGHVRALAVTLPGWMAWGAGGNIYKVEATKVDENSVQRRKDLSNRKIELERELKKVTEELGD